MAHGTITNVTVALTLGRELGNYAVTSTNNTLTETAKNHPFTHKEDLSKIANLVSEYYDLCSSIISNIEGCFSLIVGGKELNTLSRDFKELAEVSRRVKANLSQLKLNLDATITNYKNRDLQELYEYMQKQLIGPRNQAIASYQTNDSRLRKYMENLGITNYTLETAVNQVPVANAESVHTFVSKMKEQESSISATESKIHSICDWFRNNNITNTYTVNPIRGYIYMKGQTL